MIGYLKNKKMPDRRRLRAQNVKRCDLARHNVWAVMLFVAFAVMPIVDSVNGALIHGGEDAGFSLGMFYRVTIIALCVLVFASYKMDKTTLFVYVCTTFLIITPHLFDIVSASFLSLLSKLLLPILCIEAFRALARQDSAYLSWPKKLISIWSIVFPLAYLIPFALGIGYYTYPVEHAGYKAFFDAQNSLGCALAMLYCFSTKSLIENTGVKTLVPWIMLTSSIILTGLKGCYVIAIAVTVFLIAKARTGGTLRRFFVVLLVVSVGLFAVILFNDEINSIIQRWLYFGSTRDALSFITSNRVDRIAPTLHFLNQELPFWQFFGSGLAYVEVVFQTSGYQFIEMDVVDILFQFGCGGLALIFIYYASIYFRNEKASTECKFSYLIVAVFGVFAGHVFESGLGGMVLSLAAWCLISSHALQIKNFPSRDDSVGVPNASRSIRSRTPPSPLD